MPLMKNNVINAGIVGGAGYTAGELLRILLYHPQAHVAFVHDISNIGEPVYKIHRDLLGETELLFSDKLGDADVLFLCLGHGISAEFISQQNIAEHTKIIDLSNDFRLEPRYQNRTFIYGLPEVFRNSIRKADNIANPGCFATAIQLALLPLVQASLLNDEVHVNAITGSTGAGRGLSETAQFSYRNNNISIYKVFTHQHLDEINKTLASLQQNKKPVINFIPVRGNFTRGIFATLYTKCNLSEEEAKVLYNNYYKTHPFVHISEEAPSLKEALNTNKCILHIAKHKDYLLVTSIIDNLIKGASGQAVQNMNLMFGLDENAGLQLKPIAF